MSKIHDMFSEVINEAYKAAGGISDPCQKANALANIANALAHAINGQSFVPSNMESAVSVDTVEEITNMGSEDKAKTSEIRNSNTKKKSTTSTKTAKETKEDKVEKIDAKETLTPKPDKVTEDSKKEDKKPTSTTEQEPEWTEEWTDEAFAYFDSELTTLSEKIEMYGEDEVNNIVSAFSEGKYTSADELNPLNIRGFLLYLQGLETEED